MTFLQVRDRDVVITDVPHRVMPVLRRALRYRPAGYMFEPAYKYKKWDGWVNLFIDDCQFPTGLLDRVTGILDKERVAYTVDVVSEPRRGTSLSLSINEGVQERWYQKEAAEAVLFNSGGVVRAPTGSGKTVIAARIIKDAGVNSVVLVPTIDLLYQTREFLEWAFGTHVGMLGAGVIDPQPVTVATTRTMAKILDTTYYQFKYDDIGDDDFTEVESDMGEWLKSLGLLIVDECLTGDTPVLTDQGEIPIANLTVGSNVVCYNGRSTELRPVTGFADKGVRDLVAVELADRTVRCTKEHPFWTRRGWVKAGDLLPDDELLVVHGQNQKSGGKSNTGSFEKDFRFASADVATKCCPAVARMSIVSGNIGIAGTATTCPDITGAVWSNSQNWNVQPYSARCSETPASSTPTPGVSLHAYTRITDRISERGRNTKPITYHGLSLEFLRSKMLDTALSTSALSLRASHRLSLFMNWSVPVAGTHLNVSPQNGSAASGRLGWLGGCVMMAQTMAHFTPKGSECAKFPSPQSGCLQMSSKPNQNKWANTGLCGSPEVHGEMSRTLSTHTYPSACDTSWCRVSAVRPAGRERVFDIEVEEHHNFFANGVLVHNCHVVAADTAYNIATNLNVKIKVGLSASPWRDDNADIKIEAALGPIVYRVGVETLVNEGFLVPPMFRIIDTKPAPDAEGQPYDSWAKAYRSVVVDNKYRNELVVKTVNDLVDQGRIVLLLVKQLKHGEKLRKMIPKSVFIAGSSPAEIQAFHQSGDRERILNDLRRGDVRCVIATSVADMGVDVPALDALVLAGGGKSSTRHLQRIGRVCRPYENKVHGIVVDFDDSWAHVKEKKDRHTGEIVYSPGWFDAHTKARRKIEHAEWESSAIWI